MEKHINSALIRMVDGVIVIRENYYSFQIGFVEDITIITDPKDMAYSITGTQRNFESVSDSSLYDVLVVQTQKERDEVLEKFDMDHPLTDIKVKGNKHWISGRISWVISGTGVLKKKKIFNWQGACPICIDLDS